MYVSFFLQLAFETLVLINVPRGILGMHAGTLIVLNVMCLLFLTKNEMCQEYLVELTDIKLHGYPFSGSCVTAVCGETDMAKLTGAFLQILVVNVPKTIQTTKEST